MDAQQTAHANAASVPIETEHAERGSAVRGRLPYIERAKGLAILIVVLGHLAREAPPGQEWYTTLKYAVYQFHMPFFMFLSGFAMFVAYRPVNSVHAYGEHIRAKFRRLMPSFLLFGLLVLFGKEVASWYFPVDNMHAGILSGALVILVKPITSSAGFLWYIYTLFLFHAAMPLMMRVGVRRLEWLLPPALALHFWPMNRELADWFMFSQFAEYLLYVVIGFLVARDHEALLAIMTRHAAWFIGAFVLLLTAYIMIGDTALTSKTVLGLASIPALLMFVRLPIVEQGGWLATLGAYSFTIYLLNLPFMGLLKGIASFTPAGESGWFPLLALCMFAAGVLLPIALSRQLLQRVPWLDRITR